ncbi:MAG: hypothetical protein GY861_03860 [bacterium]|nr:hypothetical protein [bacterium]
MILSANKEDLHKIGELFLAYGSRHDETKELGTPNQVCYLRKWVLIDKQFRAAGLNDAGKLADYVYMKDNEQLTMI